VTTPATLLRRLDLDPNLALVDSLTMRLDLANVEYDRVDRYYTGDQPLAFLAPEIEAQVGNRLTPLVINWPETIVDSVTRRLHVEGFRLGQGGEADDELWRIFTANDLDEESPLGISDVLVHGIGFLSVWGNEDDPQTPSIVFESAHQMAVEYEAGRGRNVRAALKRWQDGSTVYATLYLKGQVIRYAAPANGMTPRYEVDQVLRNPLGAVPVVPMVNRGRLLNRTGRSELASIAPIADGINKLATDMQTTAEFYVAPRRYVEDMAIPTDPAARERMQAEMAEFWEKAEKSKFLATTGKFGQFEEATLDGYVKGINLLTAALAAIGGLPPDDLGLNTTNPASAEARRAAETTLILRAREKQAAFGGSFARAMRLAVAARDGLRLDQIPQEFSRMQVAWRDPATPAIAQAMDAAVKGRESGIYDVEAAQESVGMSPVERAAVRSRAEEAAARQATADVRARMDLARELVRTDGISLDAAMAAAGLLQAASLNSATPQTPA
jgi:hypothetical protein